MKKLRFLLMALVTVVAFTQCNENKDLETSVNGGEAVIISLDVRNHTTRADVDPATGSVTFQNGDKIHVGSGGKYVGTLTYDGTLFTGPIANATEGSPLQFYFLGNVTPSGALTSGVTESCTVSISDQMTSLPVISTAPSNENYAATESAYTARLLNKCALVKFSVTTASEAAICVTGFNNKVMVDFSENTLAPVKEGAGVIKLGAGNGEKWAILLPQAALEAGAEGSAYSDDLAYSGTRGAVPAIVENGYLTVGVEVLVTEVSSGGTPTGAVNGKFTINADNDQVYFSQGNLQYQASTGTWQFAEHQYDYEGSANSDIFSTYDGWIDLFGWGTSGFNHGAVCYQPWSTSTNYSDYYAYGEYNYNLFDQTGQADWGYNAISNGGNVPGLWRTLTQAEWDYVFNARSPLSGIRYAKAVVNNVNGVVLLPDNWNPSYYTLNSTNTSGASFTTNEISASDWATLQSHGAVFLPAAGGRYETMVYSVGSCGYYWSASYNSSRSACSVFFYSGDLYTSDDDRNTGQSVRLVRSAQ